MYELHAMLEKGKPAMIKTGPNDTIGVILGLGMPFFFFFVFLIY